MTYDGRYAFTYDAWNRLAAVRRAYRDAAGALQTASTVGRLEYDGLGRRTVKKITHSADWNQTYRTYYNGQQMIEVRNDNSQVLKQYVWGLGYIDELVQVAINQDPANADSWWAVGRGCALLSVSASGRDNRTPTLIADGTYKGGRSARPAGSVGHSECCRQTTSVIPPATSCEPYGCSTAFQAFRRQTTSVPRIPHAHANKTPRTV